MLRFVPLFLLILLPPAVRGIWLENVADSGVVINARESGRYNAGRTSLIRDGETLHLTYATSGRPYVMGESPRWGPDHRVHGVDQISYLPLNSHNRRAGEAEPEPVIYSQLLTDPGHASPELGRFHWQEDQLQGGCTNSVVQFDDRYWMFFENLFFHEHEQEHGEKIIPGHELVGIFVARTPKQAELGPDLEWEVLCADDVWRPVAETRNVRWKPILRPMISRLHDGNGQRAWELYQTYRYPEIWGVGVPSAVVKDGRILLYFWDGSHKLGALWECEQEERPPSYRGTVEPARPHSEWGDDVHEPYVVESLRIAFDPSDLETFSRHAGDLAISTALNAVESAYEMCRGDAWRAQRVRLLPEGFEDRFVVFYLKDSGSHPGRASLVARRSRDGLQWFGPVELMTFDFDPSPFKGWDRYPDEFVTVEADPHGQIPGSGELTFLYQRAWQSRVDTPLHDFLGAADLNPPLLYPGGFDLHAFTATLHPHPAAKAPAERVFRPEPAEAKHLADRVWISRIQRFTDKLLIKTGGGSTPLPDTIHIALMERNADGTWSGAGRTKASIPSTPFWPKTDWYPIAGEPVGDTPLLEWLEKSGRAATLEIADARYGPVRVPVPGPDLVADGPTSGFRPVVVYTQSPAHQFVQHMPEPDRYGFVLQGFFDPFCRQGECSIMRLHFTNPAFASVTIEAGLVDWMEYRHGRLPDPVLATMVDQDSRLRTYVVSIPAESTNLPRAAWNLQDGWECVVEVVDGLKGARDRILFPFKGDMQEEELPDQSTVEDPHASARSSSG